MIVAHENEFQRLAEILQPVNNKEIKALKIQMSKDPDLNSTLTKTAASQPKYKYLADFNQPLLRNVSLMGIIDYANKNKQDFESYFIKTSKNLFVGYIALTRAKNENVIDDVKVFTFGLPPEEDEDMIRKDVPALLDICLKKYDKISWEAHKDNKANIAYEIYRKRRNGKRDDLGVTWRYSILGNI